MTGGALIGDWLLRVVPLGGLPGGGAVAAYAGCCCCEVLRVLACSGAAVVATCTIGGTIEQIVVDLRAGPRRSGLVATLAGGLAIVDGGVGFAGEAKAGGRMTGCALR